MSRRRIRTLGLAWLAIVSVRCAAKDDAAAADGDGTDAGEATDATGTTALVGPEADAESTSAPGDDSDSTGAGEARPICDGSDELRLVLREGGADADGSDGGIMGPTWLYAQIGTRYLYVRGDCRYWVNPGQTWWRVPAHTGVLTDAQQATLAVELGYERWPEVAGTYTGSAGGGYVVLSDSTSTLRCADRCAYGQAGTAEIRPWFARGLELFDELYRQSEPVPDDGPLRVDGFHEPLPPDDAAPTCLVEWPFSFDPADAGVLPPPYPKNDPGVTRSRAVTDPEVAADLRAYWDEYVAAFAPEDPCSLEGSGGDLRFIAPDGASAIRMWIRDAVPFEDADGLVPVPTPAQTFPPQMPD